jgi:cystathionine beta-lyase/cystathionine gamma-synthase
VLSIELESAAAAAAVVDRVRCFERGASFGGVSALITHPAGVTHRGLDAAAQERAGARPGLLRLSVGVEPAELLWADLRHALDGLR